MAAQVRLLLEDASSLLLLEYTKLLTEDAAGVIENEGPSTTDDLLFEQDSESNLLLEILDPYGLMLEDRSGFLETDTGATLLLETSRSADGLQLESLAGSLEAEDGRTVLLEQTPTDANTYALVLEDGSGFLRAPTLNTAADGLLAAQRIVVDGDVASQSVADVTTPAAGLWAEVGAAAGTSTADTPTAAVWNGVSASDGVGAGAEIGAAIWQSLPSAAGLADPSATGSALWVALAAAAGVSADVIAAAALWATVLGAAGSAIVSGDGEAIIAGPTIVEADGVATGLAGDAILGVALWETVGESLGAALSLGDSGAYAGVNMRCTDTCQVMGTGLSLAMALLASAGLSTTQADGTDHAPGPGRGIGLRQLVQRRAITAGRRAG